MTYVYRIHLIFLSFLRSSTTPAIMNYSRHTLKSITVLHAATMRWHSDLFSEIKEYHCSSRCTVYVSIRIQYCCELCSRVRCTQLKKLNKKLSMLRKSSFLTKHLRALTRTFHDEAIVIGCTQDTGSSVYQVRMIVHVSPIHKTILSNSYLP